MKFLSLFRRVAGPAVLLALTACHMGSDLVICEDGATPPAPKDPIRTIQDLQTTLGAPVQTFTYDPSRRNQFTGAKGTVVSLPANAFVYRNGQPATAPVQVELREIFGKADMVLSNMPTVANGRLLESAGEVQLRAAPLGSDTLRLAPGAVIQLQTQNPPNLASRDSMRLFVAPAPGPAAAASCFSWQLNIDPASSLQPTPTGYQLSVSSMLYNAGYTWFNCDRFYNTPNPLPVVVNVPGTDVDPKKNTMVFAVFRDLNGTLRLCDYTAPGTFKAATAPAGEAISVIVIRTLNDKLYYGRQNGTITAGGQFSPTLTEISAADLQAALKTL